MARVSSCGIGFLGTLGCAALLACSKESTEPAEGSGASGSAQEETAIVVDREVGAGYYSEEQFASALEALARVAASPQATPQDLVNLACVKIVLKEEDPVRAKQAWQEAQTLCRQALARAPKLASAHFVVGAIAFDKEQDIAAARDSFAQAVASAPGDAATRLRYAEALAELGDVDGAAAQYEIVVQRGIEYAGAFYMPAIYRFSRLLQRRKQGEDMARATALRDEHSRLSAAGTSPAQDADLRLGTLGRVTVPPPRAQHGRAPTTAPPVKYEVAALGLPPPTAGKVVGLEVADLNADQREDLVVVAEHGVWIALQGDDGAFAATQVPGLAATIVRAFDLENEGRASLLACTADGLKLFSPDGIGGFHDDSAQLPPLPRSVRDVVGVDYDHDGHVDLLLATAEGPRLLHNKDVQKEQATLERIGPIQLEDASVTASLPAVPVDWVTIEDFDADQDIDFLVGGAGTPPLVISSLRKGRFEVFQPARTGLPALLVRMPLFADLDHDGRTDALLPGTPPGYARNRGDGTFEAAQPLPALAGLLGGAATLADVDLDGELDLVGVAADGTVTARFGALTAERSVDLALGGKTPAGTAPRLADFDGDADLDLVTVGEAGVELRRGSVVGGAHALLLQLRGVKDNRSGLGAIVELRAGDLYQRRLARERQLSFGLGTRSSADVVRITWPNGVIQNLLQPAFEVVVVPQKEGLAGSCPFLYTWNGSNYVFISDVLGVTPLGLPMKEGLYVPPDHDELVRVTADQLQPVDGEYRMQFTEELREVTYLDRAQLWVVDHPAGVEVHPEERFTFPPFPPQHLHTVKGTLPVTRAVDQTGKEWTEALAQQDGIHAVPFQPLPSQYLGLVTSHFLELTLPDAVKSARKVRLLMTGWLYWTDASVNVAAGRNGRFEFVPPVLSVPDGTHAPDGSSGWRVCGPPVGFPAGKTKTMVLDVTSMLNRDDPRLRIFSTIRLYWDQIRVAVDDDDAPLTVTKLEPTRAELWARGFSAPIAECRPDQPERFEWDHLEPFARWNQHRGMLTKQGDVLPLLGAIDDQYVLLSSADAIDLRFDATPVPALGPGMARTYLVFFDGWAKDADPNTLYSQTVEPLPFHGMSGYPYGPDEHYPEDDAHDAYRKEWNTRPGRKLIESMTHLPR